MRHESIWRDEPPTEPGWYWVRSKHNRMQFVWSIMDGDMGSLWDISEVQFGPRVPDPETCSKIERGDQ